MDPDFDLDWLTLDAGEEVLWADTPHPYSIVPALIVGIPLSIALVGLVIVAGAYLSYRNTNYVVTSAALYKKTGVLSRNVQRIEFDKVQDTSYRQSFLGAQFGYGTVDVSTAGGSGVEMSFANVSDPQGLQSLVNERIRGWHSQQDAGGEEDDAAAVLDEILAELRAIREAVERGGAAEPTARGEPEGTDGPVEMDEPDGTGEPAEVGKDGTVPVETDAGTGFEFEDEP